MAAAAEKKQNNKNNDKEEKKFCRICHGTDEEEDFDSRLLNYISSEWVHPCKCSGSIKWVHRECFKAWRDQASAQQRTQCSICSYFYRFSLRLKSRWFTQREGIHLMSQIFMALLATFMLVYDLATSHFFRAFFPSFTMLGLVTQLIVNGCALQRQLLKEHQLQLLLGHAHVSESLFEESIENAG